MKNKKHSGIYNKIINASVLMMTFLCLSCHRIVVSSSFPTSGGSIEPYIYNLNGVFTNDDYLKVKEDKIINGKNEEIMLKGINVGGLLVTESWMCAPRMKNGKTDHLTLTNTLVKRFGKEKTLKIWDYYRSNFWGDLDLENCKYMNMNVIRLPFSYMSLDPEFNNVPKKEGQEYNFDVLDNFIEGCARNSIYVILDMHGAYGSQNGQDHSGEIISNAEDVDFYSNEEKQNKTIHMWEEIAKHYKDVNSIAAYDLLNEPGEKAASTGERHWVFLDKVYEAIRRIDSDRPLIIESCWDGGNLPNPATYQWNNVIYSYHNYSNQSDEFTNLESYQNKLTSVYAQPYNRTVPYYMGEFNCYGNSESWKMTLSYLNEEKWHWTSWTYKLNVPEEGRNPGWGIYYSFVDYIYFDEDSYEDIMKKIYDLDTSSIGVKKMTFENSNTLERIMKTYCQQ